jgi:hypothetical protein
MLNILIILLLRAIYPTNSILFDLIVVIILDEEYKVRGSYLCSFSQSADNLSLSSKCLLQHAISKNAMRILRELIYIIPFQVF